VITCKKPSLVKSNGEPLRTCNYLKNGWFKLNSAILRILYGVQSWYTIRMMCPFNDEERYTQKF
jgi:hypothetical protein